RRLRDRSQVDRVRGACHCAFGCKMVQNGVLHFARFGAHLLSPSRDARPTRKIAFRFPPCGGSCQRSRKRPMTEGGMLITSTPPSVAALASLVRDTFPHKGGRGNQ